MRYPDGDPSPLAEAVRKGDGAAFAQLARQIEAALVGYARKLVGPDDAPELVQQTLVAVWDCRTRLPASRGPLRGFCYGVLLNQARRHFRLTRLRRGHERAAGRQAPRESAGPLDSLLAREAWDAAMALPNELRDVILARFGQGLSQRDAAAELGIPQGTLCSRQRLAIDRLREALGARAAVALPLIGVLAADGTAAATGGARIDGPTSATWAAARGTVTGGVAIMSIKHLAGALVVAVVLGLVFAVVTNVLTPADPAANAVPQPDPHVASPATPDRTASDAATSDSSTGAATSVSNADAGIGASGQATAGPEHTGNGDGAGDVGYAGGEEIPITGGTLTFDVVDTSGEALPFATVAVTFDEPLQTEWAIPGESGGIKAVYTLVEFDYHVGSRDINSTPAPGQREFAFGESRSGQTAHVRVSQGGYVTQEFDVVVPIEGARLHRTVTLLPDGQRGRLEGTVRGADGAPMAGVEVRAVVGGDEPVPLGPLLTDSAGGFVFEHVPVGEARVTCDDANALALVEVADGAITSVQLDQRVVSVTVMAADGRVLPGAEVVVRSTNHHRVTADGRNFGFAQGNDTLASAVTGPDGTCYLDPVEWFGPAVATITADGRTARFPFRYAHGGACHLTFTMPLPPVAPGGLLAIIDTADGPAAGADVTAERLGAPGDALETASATVGDDGRVALEGLRPGDWVVTVRSDTAGMLRFVATVLSGDLTDAGRRICAGTTDESHKAWYSSTGLPKTPVTRVFAIGDSTATFTMVGSGEFSRVRLAFAEGQDASITVHGGD